MTYPSIPFYSSRASVFNSIPQARVKRVLVVMRDRLLDEGVACLLKAQPDLQVLTLKMADWESLAGEVESLRPEAIIFTELDAPETAQMIERIGGNRAPKGRQVIVIRANENALDVYEQQHVVTSSKNLMNVVREGFFASSLRWH